MYKVLFYQTERGRSPVGEFISELDRKMQAKTIRYLKYLELHGPNLLRPYADIVCGKIRELRIRFNQNNVRILYFFFVEHEIILVHGFLKKTQVVNSADIELAERRMTDWIARHA